MVHLNTQILSLKRNYSKYLNNLIYLSEYFILNTGGSDIMSAGYALTGADG